MTNVAVFGLYPALSLLHKKEIYVEHFTCTYSHRNKSYVNKQAQIAAKEHSC